MIFTRGNKVTIKHFLNKRVNPVMMYYPPQNIYSSVLCDHYPYMVQIIHRRKINSKKSLFYKFVKGFNNIFINEYLSEKGGLFNLPDVITKASDLEKENIIATIILSKDIPNEKFTLSNFALIHELSTKAVIDYLETYFKNSHILSGQLLPFKLENLPIILNKNLSFEILSVNLIDIVKKLFPNDYKNFEFQMQNNLKVYRNILEAISDIYPNFLTPVLWEKLNLKESLLSHLNLNSNKYSYLELRKQFDDCLNFIDVECKNDISQIKSHFQTN